MSKYKNRKPIIDGIKFDSTMEADYYYYLKLKKSRNEIKDFSLQPKFILIDKFKYNGKAIRAITYTPDFKVENLDGSIEYIDTKGFPTEVSKLKKKMFHYFYPNLTLKWIVLTPPKINIGECGFVDKDELDKYLRDLKRRNKVGK